VARRTTILIDDALFTKLLKIQSQAILRENTTVSISSIINQIIAEKTNSAHSKKITSLIIENTLLQISKETMNTIGKRLYEKHRVYFGDYLRNPEHLAEILADEFGPAHKSIIKKIDESLKEHITEFGQK